MSVERPRTERFASVVWVGVLSLGVSAVALGTWGAAGRPEGEVGEVGGMAVPATPRVAQTGGPLRDQRWLLNNPTPSLIPESRANPVAVVDKFAARMKSIDERMSLRAYDGAPPVIPHAISGINVQTCRACHASGLRAGDKTARMVSHTYLTNCTQCHVEAESVLPDPEPAPANTFVGRRPSGYGGTRAWAGAPPVMPHSMFMRTNCVACHGEYGYDGWRPDHLSRTNCTQCHVSGAEFEQLAPTFGVPDVADGVRPAPAIGNNQ